MENKKEAIFKSTLKLIHEYGFHGSPMSQIAKQADVAIGTIYHYFQSKDDLIIDLFKYCKDIINANIFKNHDIEPDFKTRFFNLWINFVEFYIENPEYLSFFEQFYSSPYLKQVITEETICGQYSVASFLEEGVKEGYIKHRDINIISVVFIGTAVSTVKKHLHTTHQFDREGLIHIIEIIWYGIKN